jgi:hypothetical protein
MIRMEMQPNDAADARQTPAERTPEGRKKMPRREWVRRGLNLAMRWIVMGGALLWSPGAAQEPSVVLKSMDSLEKRLIKIEGDVAKLRKTGNAAPEKTAARPDSALPALSSRLDSLSARIDAVAAAAAKAHDTASAPQAAKSPAAVAAAPAGEIADLIREVRDLTSLLRQNRPPLASAPAATAASAPLPAAAIPSVTSPLPIAPGFELRGDIQIQGERKLTTQSRRDNLDDFWGRLNFGGEYKSAAFESKVNIRIFPEGFGFEPLTGATFDTSGQGSLKVQSQPQARVVINHAWVKYALGSYRLKAGRFETVETQSENFGNYVDLAPGGKFMSRPAVHNAVELSRARGPFAASLLLGTNDRKLDRGFLRLYGKYSPSPLLQASFGYRANAFDCFKYENESLLQRFDAGLLWAGLPGGWKAFAEAALLQNAGAGDDTPVLLGLQPNGGKVLDLISLEAEWSPTRRIAGRYKEWLANVHVRKALGRFKVDGGWYSDILDPAWDAFGVGMRVTSNIK